VNRKEFVRYSGCIDPKKIAVKVVASMKEQARVLGVMSSEQKFPSEVLVVIGL